ncbi:unnamed protein product [Angiostrongylus costaricensis]|uniref:MOR2-PAG1_N domain-containing protein n=1 Tax=Angiostrongylus costaricensis TaxID=334426 RepID=A0A0R3PMX6_ANGCS|nr:unnamed protein product [Angiostrongylus costaricensis]
MEKIIHEYYSDLLDSHVHLTLYEIKKDVVPPVLHSIIRHAISSVTDGQEPLVTGFLVMLNVLQEDHRPDGQSSSRKA